jgi:hypothetical protein
MKNFIVYDASGKILRWGSVKDIDFVRVPQLNEFVLEYARTNENYVVNGVPTYAEPPPPTQEELDRLEELEFMQKLRQYTVPVLYEIDKRLRVVEGAPAITLAQFKQGLKTFLAGL